MKIKTPNNFPIVIAALKGAEEKVLIAAEKGLKLGLKFTQAETRKFMRGPRPGLLGEITGRLIKSVAISAQRSGKGVIGRIGSNVKYARFHEFGFSGSLNVRAHTRNIKDKLAGGGTRGVKILRDRAGNIVGSKRESVMSALKRGVEFSAQKVKAHTRRLDYKGRPFIHPALVKTQKLIKDSILKAIQEIKP